MNSRNRVLLMVCAACLAAAPAGAQKVGSTSMQFLHVMPSARGSALGDAYSVLALGADALFWNPAGLAAVSRPEFASTYINWIFDAQQGALGFALPLDDIGAVGAQIQYVDFGEFEESTNQAPYIKNPEAPGLTGRTFRPFSAVVGVSYARALTDRFSTGVTVKFAHESLYDGGRVLAQVRQGVMEEVKTWASGLLFDFGVRYETGFRSIAVGASVQNFGSDMEYARESNPVPLFFRFGIAGNILGPDALLVPDPDSRLTVAFDLFQPNDYTQQGHLGLEYEHAGVVALRGGYKFNYDEESFTLGGGLRHELGSVRLSLDYSYGSLGAYLGSVQRISLGAGL